MRTGGGASFWLNGQHYLLTTIDATFVSETGERQTCTKTYGNRTGKAGDAIACTATLTELGQGTATFMVTAVAVP